MVQTPTVALKMSTILTTPFASAERISNQQQRQKHILPLVQILPPCPYKPFNHQHQKALHTLRTVAAGKHRESEIRQRRGCNSRSSDAEGSCGPNTNCRIEDVDGIENISISICATHQ